MDSSGRQHPRYPGGAADLPDVLPADNPGGSHEPGAGDFKIDSSGRTRSTGTEAGERWWHADRHHGLGDQRRVHEPPSPRTRGTRRPRSSGPEDDSEESKGSHRRRRLLAMHMHGRAETVNGGEKQCSTTRSAARASEGQ